MRKTSNKFIINNIKLIFIISFVIIVFLLLYFFINRNYLNYGSIKVYKSKYLVYTNYQEENNYTVNVPYLNLKGDIGDFVNNDIESITSKYISNKKSNIIYEYSISGNVLSLIIKIIDFSNEYSPSIYFKSYNVNIDKMILYSDDDLIGLYGVNYNNIKGSIENQFKNYYYDLVKEKYYTTSECSYSCFLKYRGINDYLDNVSYYVEGGNLYGYIPFVYYSVFGEEEYFTDKHFKFLLVQGKS